MAENQGEFSNAMTPEGVDPFITTGLVEDTASQMPPSNGGVPPFESEKPPIPYGQGAALADGQGNELFKPQDFGAFENWDEAKKAFETPTDEFELGENVDPAQLAKSYTHLRSKMTQDAQEVAELRREIAQFQQNSHLPPSVVHQPPSITPEELQELWVSDPAKAAVETLKANPDVLAQAMQQIPGYDRLAKAADRVEANEVVGNLRGQYKDFQTYESKIMDEIANLGDYAPYFRDIPDGVGIELLYRAVKAEELVKNIFAKMRQGQDANVATRKANNGLANLGPTGHTPPNPGQKVNLGKYGEFDAADLEFVDQSKLRRLSF